MNSNIVNNKLADLLENKAELKEEIKGKLFIAAFVRFVNKITATLTDIQKERLKENVKTPEDLINELIALIPDDKLEEMITASADEVYEEFKEKLLLQVS